MISALGRLFLIGFLSCLILAGVLFFLRNLGLSQKFAPLNHPLAKKAPLIFADGGDLRLQPAQSLSALKSLPLACPNCIAKVDARRSLDGHWFLFPDEKLDHLTNGTGYFSLQPEETIKSLVYQWEGSPSQEQILPLSQLGELFPNQAFLIVIHSRDASQLHEILADLEKFKDSQNIILHSPFRQILTDARKERPQWLFGVSTGGLTRIKMMEALYIETMADIWSDLIIAPSVIDRTSFFSSRIVQELNRRYKLIIVETDEPLDQLPDYLKKSLSGVITKNFTDAEAFFNFHKY